MEYWVFINLILYGAGVDKFTPNWFFYKVIKNYLKDIKNLFSYAVLKILDTFDVLMKNSYRCALFLHKNKLWNTWKYWIFGCYNFEWKGLFSKQ